MGWFINLVARKRHFLAFFSNSSMAPPRGQIVKKSLVHSFRQRVLRWHMTHQCDVIDYVTIKLLFIEFFMSFSQFLPTQLPSTIIILVYEWSQKWSGWIKMSIKKTDFPRKNNRSRHYKHFEKKNFWYSNLQPPRNQVKWPISVKLFFVYFSWHFKLPKNSVDSILSQV